MKGICTDEEGDKRKWTQIPDTGTQKKPFMKMDL